MKLLTLTFGFILATISFAQPKENEIIETGFTGIYDLKNNVITKQLAKKARIALGNPSKKGKVYIANKSDGQIFVALAEKGSDRGLGQVLFMGNKVAQIRWSRQIMAAEEVEKCKEVAVKNKFDKNDNEFSVFKFDQGGIIWYEFGGMIEKGFYFLTIDKDFNLVEMENFSQ